MLNQRSLENINLNTNQGNHSRAVQILETKIKNFKKTSIFFFVEKSGNKSRI